MNVSCLYGRIVVAAFALTLMAVVSGCATGPNALNYATADALDYGSLSSTARTKSAELSRAIERISRSPEHRRMQAVLADLPADMTRCLVVELADVDAQEPVPSIFAMFRTVDSVGFMSNFGFDGDGNTTEAGGGWRAAVVDAPDDADSLFPNTPTDMLPVTEPTSKRATRTVVIVTLAIPHHVISIADWADNQLDKGGRDRMIRYMPAVARIKLGAGHAL